MRQATRWLAHSTNESTDEPKPREFNASSISLAETFERPYGCPQTIDLKFMNTRPRIAQVLADTSWVEMVSMSPSTRMGRTGGLRRLYEFLDWETKKGQNIQSLCDFSFELLGAFGRWLIDQHCLSEVSARAIYSAVAQHLRAARRLHPDEFKTEFSVPSHGLAPIQAKSRDTLAPDVFTTIIRAAETEVKAIQDNYSAGNFPTHGHQLIPFMILIAANTAMNAFSLYQLRRDCLEPHPIDGHAVYLRWDKARSARGIQRQLHFRNRSRTIALLNFVLAYTEPLVKRASASQREFLFLYQYSYYFGPTKTRIGCMREANAHIDSLAGFCKKNSLKHFTFGQIRPTAATHNHLMNGGNLRKTQMLLGHKSVETTLLYLDKKTLNPLYNKSIRTAQEAMVQTITVLAKPTQEAISEIAMNLSDKQRESIIKGEYSTGFGKCKDPLNSPQVGQRKGRMCDLFLACLTCPNSLFFLEDLPRVIAIATHLRSLKNSMNKHAWETLYSAHVKVLEDEIIGAFSAEDIASARLKAPAITEMKLLMTAAS